MKEFRTQSTSTISRIRTDRDAHTQQTNSSELHDRSLVHSPAVGKPECHANEERASENHGGPVHIDRLWLRGCWPKAKEDPHDAVDECEHRDRYAGTAESVPSPIDLGCWCGEALVQHD